MKRLRRWWKRKKEKSLSSQLKLIKVPSTIFSIKKNIKLQLYLMMLNQARNMEEEQVFLKKNSSSNISVMMFSLPKLLIMIEIFTLTQIKPEQPTRTRFLNHSNIENRKNESNSIEEFQKEISIQPLPNIEIKSKRKMSLSKTY